MARIILKPGREKSLLHHHPWVYSGAVSEVIGTPQPGETVDIFDSKGTPLAKGAYSPQSQIRIRIWSWDAEMEISQEYIRNKLLTALAMRRSSPGLQNTNAIRLVHAESDGFPGLIVDQYEDILVVQFLSTSAEFWRETILESLIELTGAVSVYERSDVDVRLLEGLPIRTGLLRGVEPPAWVEIIENGLKFKVDIRNGQKTGFYLDQRLNRARVKEWSKGCEILDCFCYTGGFTISSMMGGAASVLAIDSSSSSIDTGKLNLEINNLASERVEWQEGDVFHVLRKLRDSRRSFDMVVLDPPKFAASPSQVERAARGYKDINLLAFKLLRRDGILVTFSCSGSVNLELFQKIVAGAALDANVDARVVEVFYQDCDHPTALNFPEGSYLKGLLVYVIGKS